MIKSPLNYTGNKYKLLTQILPLFPKEIDTFIDLFAGSGTVSVNVEANKHIINDKDTKVLNILKTIYENKYDVLVSLIKTKIHKFGLDRENKQAFTEFRSYYNKSIIKDPLDLFVLQAHSNNNMFRFNKSGEFNMTFGERTFNKSMEQNLKEFKYAFSSKQVTFYSKDFRNIEVPENAFIYLDPPYSLGTAPYNENGAWAEQDDLDLFKWLVSLPTSTKFALSNVSKHKGKENNVLIQWANDNGFTIHNLQANYSNASHNKKDRDSSTQEVLITNY